MASSSIPVYDVVLSSSSKDADDFSYLLCKSLTSKGIRVLRGEDGQKVEGDTTTTCQELAVKESVRFAIIILSGNYAASPGLLEELWQILERKRVSGISVLPVFYDVKPSDVEEQTGVFGESFNKNVQVFKEDPEKVQRWRIALTEVAKLIGWSSEHRNQIEIIKEIVNFVVRISDGSNERELTKEIVRRRREQSSTLTKSTDDNSVKNLPHREHLVLNLLISSTDDNSVKNLPHREHLVLDLLISAFSKIITPGLKLKDIRKLSLDGCCSLKNISPLGQLSNLQELNLSHLPRVVKLNTLEPPSNLKILSLHHLPLLNQLDTIGPLSNLQELSMSHLPLLDKFDTLGLLSNLQELWLSHLPLLTWSQLLAFAPLTNLRTFDVIDCPKLSSNLRPLRNLRTLDIIDYPQLSSNKTADIIEQSGDVEGEIRIAGNENINDHEDREGITDVMLINFINPEDREGTPGVVVIHVNDHEDREGATDATSSAEWNFLLTSLVLEIFSAGFDQASSPSKPHYALIGMLLAIAAVLTCTGELLHKGSLVLKRCQKLWWFYYPHPSNTLFSNLPDIFGLVSSICQCVFSTVKYIYISRHVDSPIKLSLLPVIFLLCLAGSMLYRNQRPSCLTNGLV